MEIPALYVYKSENKDLIDQMKKKTSEEIMKFEERRKKGMEICLKKKRKEK